MPLVDHFHPPVSRIHSWESFHSHLAVTLAAVLGEQLPYPRFLVEVHVTVGSRIEADVLEWRLEGEEHEGNGAEGGVAVKTYTAPAAVRSLDFTFPDDIEVRIHSLRDGKSLVGVIELVSPANKDRPDNRRAFAAKCLSYLHRGIGVVVIDIVTERHFNLHNELLALMNEESEPSFPADCHVYAVAYRPTHQEDERNRLDVWPAPLELNQPLPVLPLALKGGPCVPVDLESAYSDARRRCNI